MIRFVAGVRERYDRTGDEIDPVLAEALIRAALGGRDVPAGRATVTVQSLLLVGLVADEDLTDAELTAFLTEVAALSRADPPRDA